MYKSAKKKTTNEDVKGYIISKVIKLIESKKRLPWHKPWYVPASVNLRPFDNKVPYEYNGINRFITAMAGSPFFISSGDTSKLKMIPIKGSSGYPIVKYDQLIYQEGRKIKEETYKALSKDQQDACNYIPILKYYNSFSIEDIIPETIPQRVHDKIAKFTIDNTDHNPKIDMAESIINRHNPVINKYGKACYFPASDQIGMPPIETFDNSESYYATMFHELAHWTGHDSRLNRIGIADVNKFNKHQYSIEELIAELSASQLCRNCEIDFNIDNSIAYIAGWVSKLKNEPSMLFDASKSAELVIKYINKEV